MKVKTNFTEEAKIRVINFFQENMKDEAVNIDACIAEAFDRASASDTYSHYELRGLESKSGNPVIIDFSENDFEYEEIEG